MYENNNNSPSRAPDFPPADQVPPPPHQMPFPTNSSTWSIDGMPWRTFPESVGNLMEFNATTNANLSVVPVSPIAGSSSSVFNSGKALTHTKRKVETDDFVPCKQFITEDKMAQHLSGLHLSDDYQSHSINLTDTSDISSDMEYNVNLTPKELQQRLKNAQRITVCEQVRKLNQTDEIIPKVLLDRIESPCKALILWKPPESIQKLIAVYNSSPSTSKAAASEHQEQEEDEGVERIREIEMEEYNYDDDQNNNNNNDSSINYNNNNLMDFDP